MANIKWSGIESWKYGLTARWYVSAYYGNDIDVDNVGLYDPSTNPAGHGGPTRPFASLDKVWQIVSNGDTIVVDSGYYTSTTLTNSNTIRVVGDGTVVIGEHMGIRLTFAYNLTVVLSDMLNNGGVAIDCTILYSNIDLRGYTLSNSTFIECTFNAVTENTIFQNCNFIKCLGEIPMSSVMGHYRINNIFINCNDLTFDLDSIRPIGNFTDFSIIIGTVKTNIPINGKTSEVTIEDFKVDGNYFVKSYSEVDLFGNTEGSGATTTQLNTIFNNYYSPIYIDDYHNLDLTLKPTADERVRFGGLNGTYIGALPVGYRFSAYDLWNTYQDAANTSNLEYDTINNAIVLEDGEDVGTFTSTEIDLGTPITVDMVDFFANLVYNSDGTVKEGVANQRIDTTPDLIPDNTENQRIVYDYRIQYASDGSSALSSWINLELNRQPSEDGSGNYQLDDGFDPDTASKLTIQRFKIEFTLRRVIIA